MRAALFLGVFAAAAAAQEGDVAAALARARQDLAAARRENRELRTRIQRERAERLRKSAAARRREEELRRRLAGLQEEVGRLEAAAPDEAAALEALRERHARWRRTLRHAARTLLEAEKEGLVLLEHPDLAAALRAVAEEEGDPGRKTGRLLGVLARLLRESAVVSRFRATVADRDGTLRPAEILRVGQVAAYARTAKGAGALLRDGGAWRVVPLPPPEGAGKLFAGSPPLEFPLDPTGGLALTGPPPETLAARFRAGGPVMYPIAAVALLALLVTLERLVYFARLGRNLRRLEAASAAGDPQALPRSHPGPAARSLAAALARRDHGEEALAAGLRFAGPRLERALGLLALLGTVAPFLGLLGTVTGMIHTFDTITRVGTGDARLLAAGIAEALITTQAGLVVAIPILLVHAYLDGRAEHFLHRLEGFLDQVLSPPGGRKP